MKKTFLLTAMILFTGMITLNAQSHGADTAYPTKVLGRWDIVIQKDGKELPSSDYWFTVQLKDKTGKIRNKQGHFSLVRR